MLLVFVLVKMCSMVCIHSHVHSYPAPRVSYILFTTVHQFSSYIFSVFIAAYMGIGALYIFDFLSLLDARGQSRVLCVFIEWGLCPGTRGLNNSSLRNAILSKRQNKSDAKAVQGCVMIGGRNV
jgi:hypothetical protein